MDSKQNPENENVAEKTNVMTSSEENINPKVVMEPPGTKDAPEDVSNISESSESKEDKHDAVSQESVETDEFHNHDTTESLEEAEIIDKNCSFVSLSEEETISNKLDESGCESSIINEKVSGENNFLKKAKIDSHPYKHLLIDFKPTEEQLSPVDLKPCKTLEETPLVEIKTRNDLERTITELKQEKELGVDVEYSDHGYQALVCLIQISSKEKDYIIDAIALKEHVHLLSEIFVDPNIVKILHACENDLRWLQQDFDLFVINMFDTARAMRHLGYKKVGLDHVLLLNYNIQKDKSLQRADFRKRPLPPLYMDYARTDSHFLIHIYHKLKNELIQANLLQKVLVSCTGKCRIVYKKTRDASYHSVKDEVIKMHKRQLLALDELNRWRHEKAKYFDINPGMVLSRANLRNLTLQLPVDPDVIKNMCNSEHVSRHIEDIVKILKKGHPLKPQEVTVTEPPKKPSAPNQHQHGNKRKMDQVDVTNVNHKHKNNNNPKKMKNFYNGDVWLNPVPNRSHDNYYHQNYRPHYNRKNNGNNRQWFV